MLTVISPAKKLNEVPQALPDGHQMTDPEFVAQALELATLARDLSVDQLRKLSRISEPLARLNCDRFAAFSATPAPGTIYPAVQCFAGDTYQGLEVRTMSAPALTWAARHLRIISGLYGLLRPFDAIQAYRLEMGSRLANPRGADLYAFWGQRIAQSLNTLAKDSGARAVLNCASVEYFGAVDPMVLHQPVITPVFLEDRDGQAKTVSFWAKRARGAMARYVCEHQITDPADLRSFGVGGYRHQPDRSSDRQMVFLRQAPAQQAA
ncbi:MAG: peroxide stress protein YaaA [Pseudotabrizicola sp.]|uniref:peroxide stress protein YaaA n=1 Tax=Pseudotabrizicola sp. TaxID=2939647 RepID=UPI00272F0AC8|nr:peroxide stress protein YaaA [Pseudotabrizicola sp.]MDP2082125.1 peroxide stress protein YaaA [Pseudotabrizicola sp.]MDZ7576518.1 peroxide stress protein YaaA [Pseudotabrizicola sp.]